jgi:hypothetical protein
MKLSYLKKSNPTHYASNGYLDSNVPLNELGDVPIKIYKGISESVNEKSRLQKIKEFASNHKLEIATGVYLTAAALQFVKLYNDPIFGEMLRHNPPETTVKSLLPWNPENIIGNWMPQRRGAYPFETPAGHTLLALTPLYEKYVVKNADDIKDKVKNFIPCIKKGNLHDIGREIKRFAYESAGRKI